MQNTSASSTTPRFPTAVFQEAAGALPCGMLNSDLRPFPADVKGNTDTFRNSLYSKIRFHAVQNRFGRCISYPLQSVRGHGDRALRTCLWPLFGPLDFSQSPTEIDIITGSLYLFLAAVQPRSHRLILHASSSSLPDSGAIQDSE